VKNYSEFILEKNINNIKAELILEKGIFSSYRQIQNKVLEDYGSQLYYIATFNSAIVSLYPVISKIIYHSDFNIHLNKYQIVLLVIFAIAEILHINNHAIKDIRKKLKDDNLIQFVENIKKALLSIEKIVKVVAKTLGKTISSFINMLAYIAILVPVNDALVELLKPDDITGETGIENLSKKLLGLGIGLGILTLKNIVIRIFHKIGLPTTTEIEKKLEMVIKQETII
jgi:hypothetical protein